MGAICGSNIRILHVFGRKFGDLRSKKQNVAARSSVEAEFRVMAQEA